MWPNTLLVATCYSGTHVFDKSIHVCDTRNMTLVVNLNYYMVHAHLGMRMVSTSMISRSNGTLLGTHVVDDQLS